MLAAPAQRPTIEAPRYQPLGRAAAALGIGQWSAHLVRAIDDGRASKLGSLRSRKLAAPLMARACTGGHLFSALGLAWGCPGANVHPQGFLGGEGDGFSANEKKN